MKDVRFIFAGIGAVLLILVIGFTLINKSSGPKQATPKPQTMQLVDYAGNSTASLTTYGKLVGNDDRKAIRISISANERRLEVLSGYNSSVSSARSYANTTVAYQNFLSALDAQGFTRKKQSNISDQRGACPTGNRYAYELVSNGTTIVNLWAVTCDTSGTFAGRGATVRQLFQRQIPDYDKQVQNVKL